MSTENQPMNKQQKILTTLIVIVTILLIGTLLFSQKSSSLDKDSCLDRGGVWDRVQERCYDSQAKKYPQSYALACNQSKDSTFTLLSQDRGRLISPQDNRKVVTLSRDQNSQWQYTSADSQTKLSLSGQIATVRKANVPKQECDITSLTPTASQDAQMIALGVNESGRVHGVDITLQEVVQDNRCPADAVCVEADSITVAVRLFSRGLIRQINLRSDGAGYEFDQHDVSIPHIEPPRLSGRDINQGDYRVTFRVASSTESNS